MCFDFPIVWNIERLSLYSPTEYRKRYCFSVSALKHWAFISQLSETLGLSKYQNLIKSLRCAEYEFVITSNIMNMEWYVFITSFCGGIFGHYISLVFSIYLRLCCFIGNNALWVKPVSTLEMHVCSEVLNVCCFQISQILNASVWLDTIFCKRKGYVSLSLQVT